MPDAPADYTAQALRTESPITPALQTRLRENPRLVHAVLGLLTEAGELADPIKKHIFYGRPVDAINLREEIGDCLWYLAIAADALGTTLEAEQARNLAKLRTRYPHVFTADAAQVRDLDRERQVLEADVADDPHTLRQQLAAARAEILATREQWGETLKLVTDSNSHGLQLWDQLQIAKKTAAAVIVERDAVRAEVEQLKQQLANAECSVSDEFAEQQDAAAWQQQLQEAHATIEYQRAGIQRIKTAIAAIPDWPNDLTHCAVIVELARADAWINESNAATKQTHCPECERLRGELEAATAAVTLQRQGIERLRAVIDTARAMCEREDRHITCGDVDRLRAAIAELDAEPTPATEPAPCPECETTLEKFADANKQWQLVVQQREQDRQRLREYEQVVAQSNSAMDAARAEIERLRAGMATIKTYVDGMHDVEDLMLPLVQIRDALAALDAQPTPETEPAHCPECERLRAELENANEHRTDLVLFADAVRKSFRVWGGDKSFFDSVSHALDKLDHPAPATETEAATISAVKDSLTPAAEDGQ